MTECFNVVALDIVQVITLNAILGLVKTFFEIPAKLHVPLSAAQSEWNNDQVGSVFLAFVILGCFIVFVAFIFLRSLLAHVEQYLPQAPQSRG